MIISGKELASRLRGEMASRMPEIEKKYGRVPHLVVILVGENPASQTYVRNKGRAAESVGMRSTTIVKPADISEAELLELIAQLNADDSVDGLLVQLPLPRHISEQKVIDAIAYEKDVDGFHPVNVANLWLGKPCTVPCTPKGVMKMLEDAGVELAGKSAVVVGRSNIVGKPVAKLLLDANATVTIAHSRTADLAAVVRGADVVIAAVGVPKLITGDMVKPGAVVIDVGINRLPDGTLCGDVDFDSVKEKASLVSPVPGGVGPMTIAMLMDNTIECFLRRF